MGKYLSIAVDGSGNVHISYYNDTNDDLKYATNTGGSWTAETVDGDIYVGRYTSIAVDGRGRGTYYHDDTSGDLKYARQ